MGVPHQRLRRQTLALAIAGPQDGVAHRGQLRAAGITRYQVRSEVRAGRWQTAGRHTVVNGNQPPTGRALAWRAVWESGAGAVVDGAAALLAGGLRGYLPEAIDVAVPARNRSHPVDGVRCHRRRDLGPVVFAGLPRTRPEWAAIRAAQWARSDRQAALVLCLAVQQRLVSTERLLGAWSQVRRSPRRQLLDQVIRDLCDGAHSLGELDFARLCRARGLPEPSRQTVMSLPSGRVYLDVRWAAARLVVEVDGGHHAAALTPVDDALRQNELVLRRDVVLRIPVVGLRLAPDAFLDQVIRAHRRLAGAA